MKDTIQSSSGTEPQASGNEENQTQEKETVAYETYRKLLGEKKKRDEELEATKAKLAELSKAEKLRQEAELKEKEDFKTLLQRREEELQSKEQELSSIKGTLESGAKLRAFLDSVNGVVEKQYWTLVDLDEVKIDPNTGLPDPLTVEALARKFESEYPLVVKPKGQVKIPPNQAAQGSAGKLTHAEWKALGSAKEMKEKMHLVDWSTQ